MDDCIFCKIVKKEIPASIAYEDTNVLAFMTIEAVNLGHVLVIPKQHYEHYYEMPQELFQTVMEKVYDISKAVKQIFNPEKVGMSVSGWEVPHAHIHVIPMTVPSDITSKKLLEGTALHPTEDERNDHAAKIKSALEQ